MFRKYGANVGPMLIDVRLLEAMLGPYLSHVALMLSQERRVPFKPLPRPKRNTPFLDHVGTMLGRDHVGRIWSQCWAYVDRC